MQVAPQHPREDERNETIEALGLHHLSDDSPFVDVVALVSGLVESSICLFSVVYRDQQIFHAATGLKLGGTSRNASFCAHAIVGDEALMEVPASRFDPRFADNPLVVDNPRIQAYAGRVIKAPNGLPIGTICVIDRIARKFSDSDRHYLECAGRLMESLIRYRAASHLH